MEDAKKVISEIAEKVSQKSASHKDEVTVMKAIMNDPNYTVEVYEKEGKVEDYCPTKDLKKVITNVVSSVTHMPNKEAAELVDAYEFTKADASSMIDFSKEFINSYLQTGRKLPLGGRITSNIELIWKNIESRTTEVPAKDGGERHEKFVPAHGGIKVSNSCPKWVK